MTLSNEQDKMHISPTQITMFYRCAYQWYKRYIEGKKIPPGIAMIKGRDFHYGAQINFEQKIDTNKDMPVSDVVDAVVTKFNDDVSSNEIMFSDDEKTIGVEKVIGKAKDSVVKMTKKLMTDIAPKIQPTLVEEKIEIEMPGEYNLLGVLDLVDDKQSVIDFKTKSRKMPTTLVATDIQLTTYAALYKARTGKLPKTVKFHVIIDNNKGIQTQMLFSRRTNEDLRVLANYIEAMEKSIRSGVFLPAPIGSWICNPRFCGYYNECPYANRSNI